MQECQSVLNHLVLVVVNVAVRRKIHMQAEAIQNFCMLDTCEGAVSQCDVSCCEELMRLGRSKIINTQSPDQQHAC